MSSPIYADVIEVQHFDGSTTTYQDARYYLYRDGVTVVDEDGAIVGKHSDVLAVNGFAAAR